MIRLNVIVEGQTEETFVRDVLAPELGASNVLANAHRITTRKTKARVYRGGFVEYEHLRRDLMLRMKQEQGRDCRFTTMVDLYALPPEFPGYAGSQPIRDPLERAQFLENALAADVGDRRFIPYIQVHEFEALLFSDPSAFAVAFPDAADAIRVLQAVRESVSTPHHIDDGRETAPSKRICSLLPSYDKVISGLIVAKAIGLPRMRRECPHFNCWVSLLLGLGCA